MFIKKIKVKAHSPEQQLQAYNQKIEMIDQMVKYATAWFVCRVKKI